MMKCQNLFLKLTLFLLCLCLLVGCAAVAPTEPEGGDPAGKEPGNSAPLDGEIGSNPPTSNSPGSSKPGSSADAEGSDAPSEEPELDAAPVPPGADEAPGDGTIGGSGSGFEHQAGQLTASEWNDNDHFAEFIDKINAQGNGWYDIAAKWNQVATKRIHVRVHNGSEQAVHLATVTLLDANGGVLWSAVTDADGDAYLFYGVSPSVAFELPASIAVVARDGKKLTHSLTGNEAEVVLALDSESSVTKLDVMFMIDTTGSMGDELEYLKAEMGDVIRRVAQECGIGVRTSVNFYRDQGDEYELRYFDFRSNVEEVVSILAQQRAYGGGDYPEAVGTALNYAMNQASWDKDAIKIMFLVLDAPPHYNADTIATINRAIVKAAEQGIRIIPVASSGVNTECQVLFRTWAALTGGTYTYLTDHSGIGGSHDKPDVEETNVELLNDMMVRIIKEYVQGKPEEDIPEEDIPEDETPEVEEELNGPTYTDSFGDTFTYRYLSSTTVEITGFSGSAEPHRVTIPAYVIEEDVELKVVRVGDSAFFACSNISAVKCEAELEKINRYTFAYCEALAAVELPDSLKSIGNGAFYHCSALETIDLGKGVQDIGKNAFSYCTALSNITFPASLRTIDAAAFTECTALTAIELPEGIVSVGEHAFYNCSSVETLTLPASLTDIGAWAFNPFLRTLPDEAIIVPEGSAAAEYIKQYRS